MTVNQLRKELHTKVSELDEIEMDDLKLVNTFSRMELIKEKTREITALASAFAQQKDFKMFHTLFDAWDALAIDWVYSDVLDYSGSLADAKAKEIESEIAKRR